MTHVAKVSSLLAALALSSWVVAAGQDDVSWARQCVADKTSQGAGGNLPQYCACVYSKVSHVEQRRISVLESERNPAVQQCSAAL